MSTGEHSAVEPPKPPPTTLPGVLLLLASVVFRREALLVVTSSIVLLGAGAGGVVWAQAKLDGGVAEKVAPLREDIDAERVRLDEHLKDDAQQRREVTRRLDETSADIRALYRAVMTGRPQERLEQPVPAATDGGQ